MKRVTVLGTGVLGSQIAYNTAFHGKFVTAYDISDEILEKAKERFAGLAATYKKDGVEGAKEGEADAALARISYSSNLAEAVQDADLVIEAVPEVLEIKQQTYEQLGKVAPGKTIFASNSSTLPLSAMKDFTGRPKRFIGLHFANQVWKFNTAEVMSTTDTDPRVFEEVVQFAKETGMVPIPIRKEKPGWLLNSLLVPLLTAAMDLAYEGYAEPEDIDKVWQIATGAPMGPFAILDVIGLTTPYNISVNGDAHNQEIAAWLKENYIDKGRLGVASGAGFYDYPKKG